MGFLNSRSQPSHELHQDHCGVFLLLFFFLKTQRKVLGSPNSWVQDMLLGHCSCRQWAENYRIIQVGKDLEDQ